MNDLISRQAAIDAVEHITSSMSVCVNSDECHGMKRMQRQTVIELTNLPPAQPEIIRCKECLWRIGRDCTRFTDLPVYMDDYCGRAKRRGEQDDESRSNSNAQTDARARGMGATDNSSGI